MPRRQLARDRRRLLLLRLRLRLLVRQLLTALSA